MSPHLRIARRYRAQGETRSAALAALSQQGVSDAEADQLIDEADRLLASEGRSLPSDANVGGETRQSPVSTKSPITSSEQMAARARNQMLLVAKRALGGPPLNEADATHKRDMASEALRKAGVSSEAEIDEIITEAVRLKEIQQARFARAANRPAPDVLDAPKEGSMWGVLWIVGGALLLLLGLAVGRITSIVIGGVLIWTGIKTVNGD